MISKFDIKKFKKQKFKELKHQEKVNDISIPEKNHIIGAIGDSHIYVWDIVNNK